MAGLRRICRMYGGMTVTEKGKKTKYLWDYANETAVKSTEMTKAMQKASDIAWAKLMKEQIEAGE